MKKLYLSGPMSGLPEDNYPAFRQAAAHLRSLGYAVEDPSEHFRGKRGLPRHRYLAADVLSLIRECDSIALMPGWSQSQGACLELQVALDLGYEVFIYGLRDDELTPADPEHAQAILDSISSAAREAISA